jgi:hypothetical protein
MGNTSNIERVLIGHVPVDSGQMMVVDPCYIRDNDFYGNACSASLSDNQAGAFSVTGNSSFADAVCSSTGYGDGMYPVFIEYEDCGDWGRRVKSITVEFISDEEYDGWDEGEDYDNNEEEDEDA